MIVMMVYLYMTIMIAPIDGDDSNDHSDASSDKNDDTSSDSEDGDIMPDMLGYEL